jgi:hypothetical protein
MGPCFFSRSAYRSLDCDLNHCRSVLWGPRRMVDAPGRRFVDAKLGDYWGSKRCVVTSSHAHAPAAACRAGRWMNFTLVASVRNAIRQFVPQWILTSPGTPVGDRAVNIFPPKKPTPSSRRCGGHGITAGEVRSRKERLASLEGWPSVMAQCQSSGLFASVATVATWSPMRRPWRSVDVPRIPPWTARGSGPVAVLGLVDRGSFMMTKHLIIAVHAPILRLASVQYMYPTPSHPDRATSSVASSDWIRWGPVNGSSTSGISISTGHRSPRI